MPIIATASFYFHEHSTPNPSHNPKNCQLHCHYNNYFKTLVNSILCKSVFFGKPIVAPETMLGPFPPLETSFGGTDFHALFRWFFQNTFFKKISWRTLKITLCRYRLTILETEKLPLKLNLYAQDLIVL